MTYLILLPHMQALFLTSLVQTGGHKMVALSIVFLQLQIGVFSKQDEKSSEKLLCMYSPFDRAHETSLVLIIMIVVMAT